MSEFQNKTVIRCALTPSSTSLAEESRKQWLAKKAQLLRKEKQQQQKQDLAQQMRQLKLIQEKSQRNYECSLKVKEWQQQKAKEIAKKRQEDVLLTKIQEPNPEPDLDDKRKEIFNKWVQMKLKKQDSERKRQELEQKVVEANRESRKFLAQICYQHWKESAKRRNIAIPRNGFQVFGPKPKPVVVQEWVSCDSPDHNDLSQ